MTLVDLTLIDRIALGVGLGVLLIGAGLAFGLPALQRRRHRSVSARLERLDSQYTRTTPARMIDRDSSEEDERAARRFRKAMRAESQMSALERLRLRLERRIARAGGRPVAIRIGLFVAASALAAGYAAIAGLNAGATVAAPAAGAVALLTGWITLRRAEKRFAQAFLDSLPDAIDLIVRAVRSGIPVSEAIKAAGRDTKEPVRGEFARVADQVQIGVDLEDALVQAAKRVEQPDFRFLVVSLSLQRETGGRLAETLENLSDIIRRRKEMRLKIRAMTSEGRMSARIVALIPLAAIGGLWLTSPDYILPLVQTGPGMVILFAAAGIMGTGMLIINRMVAIEP